MTRLHYRNLVSAMRPYIVISGLLTRLGQRARRDLKLFDYTRRLLENTSLGESVILDAGCGSMSISSRLAQSFGKPTLVGLDVQRQTEKVGAYLIADAEQMPLRSGSIDVYLSFSVLEHLRHPVRHVQEVARVLKPTGLAVLQVPNEKYIVEPHSLIPFYFVFPKFMKRGLMRIMGYSYLWINDSVTPEYVSNVFRNNGFAERAQVGIYHFDFLKHLVTAPSYLFEFGKLIALPAWRMESRERHAEVGPMTIAEEHDHVRDGRRHIITGEEGVR